MSKHTNLISLAALFVVMLSLSVPAQASGSLMPSLTLSGTLSDTDRDRDGLLGPVRRIRTETTKLTNKGGKQAEGQRVPLETAAYDIKGIKIENAYFPVAGAATLTGREVYKYDEKGNISEMTLVNADGSLLSKEVYSYEYDFVGNWTKMTTSVAVIEGGKLSFEPTEVTYRTISYYLDENLAKMMQPDSANGATAPATTPASKPAVQTAANNPPATAQANQQKTAVIIPASTGIATLNKSTETGPISSTSMPGGTGAGNKPAVVMETEPPAVKAAPKPLLKPVSGGVLNGKAIELPSPEYPEIARRMRATGMVSVEVVIDVSGKVISAKAVSGNGMFHQAAVQAALRARFSPTTLSGQPVKVTGSINYNFSLAK
ncbi:MAG: energy transducer TonB [Pyrinomonadaceae bacterium]|nr:energy transducer TonB [Pyrinomonadaceae bacterium]